MLHTLGKAFFKDHFKVSVGGRRRMMGVPLIRQACCTRRVQQIPLSETRNEGKMFEQLKS